MKKCILILLLLIYGCCPSNFTIRSLEFENSFSSENNRIASLMKVTVFHGSLDSLTYDFYLDFLRSQDLPITCELIKLIENSEEHLFKTKKDAFLIALLDLDSRTILFDNSFTNWVRCDSSKTYLETESIPTIEEFMKNIVF